MNKTRKALVIVTIAAMVLAVPLGAQNSQSSNTNLATAGIFGNEVDDYMSYHYWSGVQFEKWFGFAGWNGNASFGYARNLGGAYLGTWFNGNIINIPSATYTETITPTWDPINKEKLTEQKQIQYPGLYYTTANNELAVLIGIANMGIKVGVVQALRTNKFGANATYTETDNKDGWIRYQGETLEFSSTGLTTGTSAHKPYIGWGGNFGSIKPYVTAGFIIANSKHTNITTTYDKFDGQKVGLETISYNTGRNESFLAPDVYLGADIDLASKEESGWNKSVGIEYNLYIPIYNNDFSGSGISGTAKGPTSWTTANKTINRYNDRTEETLNQTIYIDETTGSGHAITPSFTVTNEALEGLKIGFRASLPVGLAFATVKENNEVWAKTETTYTSQIDKIHDFKRTLRTVNYGDEEKSSIIDISAQFALGASYQLVPERFGIHAGLSSNPIGYSRTTTTTKPVSRTSITYTTEELGGVTVLDTEDTIGNFTGADRKSVNASWNEFSYGASGGFTFNFNQNAFVDMVINSTGVSGALNLANVRIMFVFKY